MVTVEKMMSVDGQHALQDMVELEMYLLAQSRLAPWFMLPRRCRKISGVREPYSSVVEWSAAMELVDHGFIEPSSSRTFVVSKSGYQFYELEMRRISA